MKTSKITWQPGINDEFDYIDYALEDEAKIRIDPSGSALVDNETLSLEYAESDSPLLFDGWLLSHYADLVKAARTQRRQKQQNKLVVKICTEN